MDLIPENKLILAPLAGVSDGAYRYLCAREGCGLSCTEMVSAKGLYYKSPGTAELLEIKEREGRVGIQLFGSEPKIIAWAIEQLADSPAVLFDINMGCPVPKVFKNGEGSALVRDPDNAARIVEAAAEAAERTSGKPITIKMRLATAQGQYGKTPSEAGPCDLQKSIDFAKTMENAGASMITVHGRTREQYYSGSADWQALAEIKKQISIPMIGNGDVRSIEDAKRMMQITACDAVMIGRGSMGNPWIFSGSEPDNERRKAAMRLHLELLLETKGRRAVLEMRKHFAWYTKGLSGASALRQKVNTAETAEEIIELIDELV